MQGKKARRVLEVLTDSDEKGERVLSPKKVTTLRACWRQG